MLDLFPSARYEGTYEATGQLKYQIVFVLFFVCLANYEDAATCWRGSANAPRLSLKFMSPGRYLLFARGWKFQIVKVAITRMQIRRV